MLREALRVFGGPDSESPTALDVRYYLGAAQINAGRVAEGSATLRRAIPGLIREYGGNNVRVRNAQKALARG